MKRKSPRGLGRDPADLKSIDPGSPANADVQAKIDADWYEKNYSKARQEFLDMIAS